MENSEGTNVSPTSNKQNGMGLKIAVVVTSILAIVGIAFGVFGMMDSNNKAKQIVDLQSKISQLEQGDSEEAEGDLTLLVEESSWSGWSEDYEPEVKTHEIDIQLGKKYVVKTEKVSTYEDGIEKPREEEVLSFEITSIDEDSIGIHTFQVFSDKEEGIDLMSDKQDFTVTVDEPLKLTTPTMDEGDIFTLTLSRK